MAIDDGRKPVNLDGAGALKVEDLVNQVKPRPPGSSGGGAGPKTGGNVEVRQPEAGVDAAVDRMHGRIVEIQEQQERERTKLSDGLMILGNVALMLIVWLWLRPWLFGSENAVFGWVVLSIGTVLPVIIIFLAVEDLQRQRRRK